ncbi:MAG: choloylglycine hydrolase [Clostridia bacterium]|nr:choloylglycine hydrolase [Clostridia bacterium]
MCTAISLCGKKHFFGRNLDFEHSFGEKILITPRNFPLVFRHTDSVHSHYAMIGMGIVSDGYPLYFDATNEKGLSMAGLLFSGYAHYHKLNPEYTNLAPFEVILWVLSQCANTEEAKELLGKISVTNTHFSHEYPNTPLHWIISDKKSSIVLESLREGIKIYDNPTHVLTNSPPFEMQIFNLNNYMPLSPFPPENKFGGNLNLITYSRGMGALGLPGDFSSASRFVRAAFFRANCKNEKNEAALLFDMLKNLSPLPGCVITEDGKVEVTIYSSCVDTEKGIYYYTTYGENKVSSVSMYEHDLTSDTLATFSYNLLH